MLQWMILRKVLHEERVYWKGGSDKQAKIANQMEQERQARMKEAIAAIRSVFNGETGINPLTDTSAYKPNATYYNADGSVFTAPTKTVRNAVTTGIGEEQRPYTQYIDKTVIDQDALGDAIRAGQVFSGVAGNRDRLYDEQEQAVYDLNAKSVNDQYERAERNNRFGLARNGLMGGSADVDSNADLQKTLNEGLVQARALGQQAAGQLRSSDESAKQNLISLAESGMDASTAANLAQSQMATNMQNALGQRGASAIQGLFDGLMAGYLNNRVQDAYQRGYDFGTYGNSNATGLNSQKTYKGSAT